MKRILKVGIVLIGTFASVIIGIVLVLTILQKIHIDEKFALVDEMLGIERRDYSVCRRGSYMSRLQDPVVAQEIKLKAKGVERINGYVLSYQTNLLTNKYFGHKQQMACLCIY